METTPSTASRYQWVTLQAKAHPYALAVFRYLLACVIIYLGFWTAAPRTIPANTFDETLWMSHSVCADAVLTSRYHEVCREINIQGLDHTAMGKYVLALGRWWTGIPPEAVGRLYTTDVKDLPLDPLVRDPMVRFLTLVSSISLLILFAALCYAFGSLTAFLSLMLIMATPYWHHIIRTPLAEVSIFFFSCLTFASMLLLFHALIGEKQQSLARILVVAGVVGCAAGSAIGVKINAALVLIGFGAVLLYALYLRRAQWLLLIWVGAIVGLVAAAMLYLSTPFLWDGNPVERYQMLIFFRSNVLFGMMGGGLLDVSGSVRSALSSAFSTDYFNILPLVLSFPLCAIGLWYLWKGASWRARTAGLWLLVTGGVNTLVVPVAITPLIWDRYGFYTVFVVHIFMALGASRLIKSFLRQRLMLADERQVAMPQPRTVRLTRGHKSIAIVCLIGLVSLATITGVATVQTRIEGKLWQAYILSPTLAGKLKVLAQILEHNPHARRWYNHEELVPSSAGDPLQGVLVSYFQRYRTTNDPALLTALWSVGQAVIDTTNDAQVQALLQHDMQGFYQHMGQRLHSGVQVGPFTNTLPPDWVPAQFRSTNDQLLMDPGYVVATTITIPADGTYRLAVTGANWGPPPIIIGVFIDGQKRGELQYVRGDSSWSDAEITTQLTAGSHAVTFQLLNDLIDRSTNTDRNGAIRRLQVLATDVVLVCADGSDASTLQARPCPLGAPAAALSATHTRMMLPVAAPVDAVYSTTMHLELTGADEAAFTLHIDDMPVGGIFRLMGSASQQQTITQTVNVPPLFLKAGEHQISLERAPGARHADSVVLKEVTLTPRYPDTSVLPATAFRSADSSVLKLANGAQAQASWKWYSYGYGFYSVRLLGHAANSETSSVAVAIDDTDIGVSELDQDGTLSKSLVVELARGSAHTLTLQAPQEGSDSVVYSVLIEPYQGPLAFAGSSMQWDRSDNAFVSSSDGGVLHVPQHATVRKELNLDSSDVYTLKLQTRAAHSQAGKVQIRVGVDGWPMDTITAAVTSQWTEQTATVAIPAGKHTVDVSWQSGDVKVDLLDFRYATLQSSVTP